MSEPYGLLLLEGLYDDIRELIEASDVPAVLVTAGADLVAVDPLDVPNTLKHALAIADELLGESFTTGAVSGAVLTADDDVVLASGPGGVSHALSEKQAEAVRRLGIRPSARAVRVVVTAASADDVESAANVARVTVWTAPAGDGLSLVTVERPEGSPPDETASGELAAALSARRRPSVELWRDQDVQGVFVWTRKGLDSHLVWGRSEELVLPASWSETDRAGLGLPVDTSPTVVADAVTALPNPAVDQVGVRALSRRRDLVPDAVTAALVDVLRLPYVVDEVLSSRTSVAQLSGARRVEGKGLKAELGRVWKEPLPDGAPGWLRIQDTRPLWFRILSAIIAVVLSWRTLLLWTGDDASTGTRVLAVVTGLIALASAEVAVGRARRRGRSEA
jgi:hypothetical protein